MSGTPQRDVKKDFVYKRVPHVTLKSIANNEEVDTIHAWYQEQLEHLRAKLNAVLKQKSEEWEIPRELSDKWPKTATEVHAGRYGGRGRRRSRLDRATGRYGIPV